VQEIFSVYDRDDSGVIDYKAWAAFLCRMGSEVASSSHLSSSYQVSSQATSESRASGTQALLQKFKAKVHDKGLRGVFSLLKSFKNMDLDGSNSIC